MLHTKGNVPACVGERIKFLRNKRGMTQRDFAKMCNTTQAQLSRVESGWRQASDTLLENVSKLCLVSVQWLKTGGNAHE